MTNGENSTKTTNPSKVDLDELYATICAASASKKPLKRRKSLLEKLMEMASMKKERLINGDGDALPMDWGVNGYSIKHWSEVTPKLLFEPLRADISLLQDSVENGVLLSRNLTLRNVKQFIKWIGKFECHIKEIWSFKYKISHERLVYGFEYQVNTTLRDFWTLMDELKHKVNVLLSSIDVCEGAKEKFISPAEAAFEVQQQLLEACKELSLCLNDEEALTKSLLLQHFNQTDEHESIIYAISALKMPTEGFALARIVAAMPSWLGNGGKSLFLNALPMQARWTIQTIGLKYVKEYESLLGSLCRAEKDICEPEMESGFGLYSPQTERIICCTPTNLNDTVTSYVSMP